MFVTFWKPTDCLNIKTIAHKYIVRSLKIKYRENSRLVRFNLKKVDYVITVMMIFAALKCDLEHQTKVREDFTITKKAPTCAVKQSIGSTTSFHI